MDCCSLRKACLSTFATLAIALTGCGDDTTPASTPGLGATPLPTPTFITSSPGFTDYRPAVDKTGTRVLFERTPYPNPGETQPTVLYLATGVGGASPVVAPFLTVPATPPSTWPYSQTRPDWSWVTNEVAFSGAPSNNGGPIQVHVVAADGVAPRLVPDTVAHIYPIWTSDGTQLVVYDNNANVATPGPPPIAPPVTRLINPDGTVAQANLNGLDAAGVQVFGGFAAPKPGSPTQIAYAGQPAVTYWGTTPPSPLPNPLPPPAYDQDNNYVFVNKSTGGAFSSAPLEANASIATYMPAYQGRAPYWSPDGNYVVFESSRNGGYALFLANVTKGTAPVQLTATGYWAQHAKFLPGGKSIVFTALQTPSAAGTGPRGIALLDISSFLN
jgi:hypothetical protein